VHIPGTPMTDADREELKAKEEGRAAERAARRKAEGAAKAAKAPSAPKAATTPAPKAAASGGGGKAAPGGRGGLGGGHKRHPRPAVLRAVGGDVQEEGGDHPQPPEEADPVLGRHQVPAPHYVQGAEPDLLALGFEHPEDQTMLDRGPSNTKSRKKNLQTHLPHL
jgi:hypothetical protein